ncbi:uncharacterized protein [Oryza sativa Japonica Group]|uniref:Os11g0703600 protein n=6 Tax=Oryza TaxID=4527 RepID=A0A0P0Y617_ORYSJ|nr:uncharacterized protein LOC4351207 [Oryza sativa Japonica Group]EAY81897.1 hypothetical protein OsI_37063 [Oryza sativa Indica Group]KAB8116190.1 hypothetical protein EE612_057180 [Oryza sativa]AAX95349.1 conserved hypothetical protein [Oryza sativa Japonica Group]ABA95496.1 expressed protein [Oryza sativa Japonica Group]ABA95497.1 expressed protein [Oryza sativa Japonica Group]|eukprot:NP_001068539.1 Os11g0703600 [Oryza sativa Japonica Group]
MRALSRVGVGLAVVSALLLLALAAELYYLFVYKRRRSAAISDAASSPSSSSRELLQLFCFKKPPALASTYAQEPHAGEAVVAVAVDDDDDTVEAQLMRLGSLVGPTRLLFTIKEETKEDLESEDGRSRCGRSRSLAELLHSSETPFMTPASSPLPMDKSFNPLFEPTVAAAVTVSPPPKFQFLKDAEEKMYRRALAEEAMRARRSPQTRSPAAAGEEDGGYITIMVGKNNKVIPLPSPPSNGDGDLQ